MMSDHGAGVRIAGSSEGASLGSCIGVAFAQDPVARWTLGAPDLIETTFALLAEHLYVPAGHSTIVEGVGGALWLAPNQPKSVSFALQLSIAKRMLSARKPRHIMRTDRVDRVLKARRPSTPHYYLFAIGVLPESRGRGIAGELLSQTLARADKANMPAFLENSNPINTPLYERHGFRAGTAFEAASGCPLVLPMWREPNP